MRETLNVEYVSPAGGKKDRDDKAQLDGCVGEVDKGAFQRALRQAKLNEDNRTGKVVQVPVRFALNFPASVVGFYPNWSFGQSDTDEQGILLPIRNLRVTKRIPASAYKRTHLQHHQLDVKTVFEKPVYYYTASRARLQQLLSHLSGILPKSWIWTKESKVSGDKPLVFLEARIYGADTVIPVYSRRFQGVAVQIITRDILTSYAERMASDLYLFSNTSEYVEYFDGVAIEREAISASSLMANISAMISPREFMALKGAKPVEKKKVVEAETVAAAPNAAP